MACCLFYCHFASQLDPKPLKRVMHFWFSTPKENISVKFQAKFISIAYATKL